MLVRHMPICPDCGNQLVRNVLAKRYECALCLSRVEFRKSFFNALFWFFLWAIIAMAAIAALS